MGYHTYSSLFLCISRHKQARTANTTRARALSLSLLAPKRAPRCLSSIQVERISSLVAGSTYFEMSSFVLFRKEFATARRPPGRLRLALKEYLGGR